MVLNEWRTWLTALVLVLLEGPHTFAQLEWHMVRDMVKSRLDQDPMVRTLQEGSAKSYAYTYSPSGFSSRIGIPEFSGDIQMEAEDLGHPLTPQPEDNAELSLDVQPRFLGKFEEWYKGKGKDKEEKSPQIVISTHHGISSHDLDHHHSDHHNHHDHSHSYHGAPHAYLPIHHHVPPPPVYHYPHHHQQPVVKPIFIETGHGNGGGNKKKKGGKGSAGVSVYTETVVVTKPHPVVLTQTVTHQPQTHSHPVYVPTSKPEYVKPSEVYVQSSKPIHSKPSHVYITTHTTIYTTPSHVYTQTHVNTPYLTPSHIFIQEPHTEYVAVSVETQDHGWGWGWDLFGSKGKGSGYESGHVQVIGGNGHHHGVDIGKGQVVYVMGKPQVTPQAVTTQVVVQQQVPLTTHLAHPSTSEVVFMERPSHTIKKGFDKVKETFQAFGDGIKGVGDRIAEGVHNIKSKFSFQSKGNVDPQYVLLHPQSTHSVLVVTTAAPQTVVIQKPVIHTSVPKPIVHTIAAYQPMVSSKGGAYFKGHYKGYSSGGDKSKSGDTMVFVSGEGHGHGHGYGHH